MHTHTYTHKKKVPMPHTRTQKETSQLQKLSSSSSGLCSKAHMFGDIRCLDNTINTFIILLHPAETVRVVQIILVEQQTTLTEIKKKNRVEQYFTCSEDSDHRIAANSEV